LIISFVVGLKYGMQSSGYDKTRNRMLKVSGWSLCTAAASHRVQGISQGNDGRPWRAARAGKNMNVTDY